MTLPLAPTVVRQPCTCIPPPGRQVRPCVACVAWDRHRVLLVDGTEMSQVQWLLAHEAKRVVEEGI
jgi:hypothetical protein